MSISSSTLGVVCGVSWVIGSGCGLRMRVVCLLLTTCDGMNSAMIIFTLIAISFMNYFMFSLSNSLTSTIIDVRMSFIMSNSSFHSNVDFFYSKSSVMSS